jgi:hypothetical protein
MALAKLLASPASDRCDQLLLWETQQVEQSAQVGGRMRDPRTQQREQDASGKAARARPGRGAQTLGWLRPHGA